MRLKSLMDGPAVKRQATSTLRCMQTLSRVQCQIRMRRIRMIEENQALQRQILQKHAKELVNLQVSSIKSGLFNCLNQYSAFLSDFCYVCSLNCLVFLSGKCRFWLFKQMGEDWDDSLQSKEQIEASLLSKHEAAMRRERAMAYSFTHQVIPGITRNSKH